MNVNQGQCSPFDQRHYLNEVLSQIGPRVENDLDKDFFDNSAMTLIILRLRNLYQSHCTYPKAPCDLSMSQIGQRYAPDKKSLTDRRTDGRIDLETWLKVAAHLLQKSSVYVKYDPDMAR